MGPSEEYLSCLEILESVIVINFITYPRDYMVLTPYELREVGNFFNKFSLVTHEHITPLIKSPNSK
jgi:hypothetical protein